MNIKIDIFINWFWYLNQLLTLLSKIDIFINYLYYYQKLVPLNCNFAVKAFVLWERSWSAGSVS